MSHRVSTAREGDSPVEVSLRSLAKSVSRLATRLARLESRQPGIPGLRFEREVDQAGDWYLVVERTATGNRERIAGPL